MRKLLAGIACMSFLVIASPAWAGGGNSSVDQYTEQIPTAGGGGGGDSSGGSGDSSGDPSAIPQATAQTLESQGEAGQAAADLAKSTAPKPVAKSPGPKVHGKGADVVPADERAAWADVSNGGSAGNAVGNAVGGDAAGGLGVALPIILAASLLGAIALLISRRRAGGTPRAS